jgi:hypothetical protein
MCSGDWRVGLDGGKRLVGLWFEAVERKKKKKDKEKKKKEKKKKLRLLSPSLFSRGHKYGQYHPAEFHYKVKGHVNYILSPNRQRYFVGFFSNAPQKFLKKLGGAWAWAPGLAFGYGCYTWANWKEKDIAHSHRL